MTLIRGIDFASKLSRTSIAGLLDGKASVSLVDFHPRIVSNDPNATPEHHVAHCARISFNNKDAI